jgi:hypothetical protein
MSACWAFFPLAAWNFSFQNHLSPFLAWGNIPHLKNWDDYCVLHQLNEVPPKFNFFSFTMSQFDWLITQTKMKLRRLPKIEGFIVKYRVPPPPFGPGERRTIFAKACYGICFELSPTPSLPSQKQGRPLHSMTQLPIGCMEILFIKFWLPVWLAWNNGP